LETQERRRSLETTDRTDRCFVSVSVLCWIYVTYIMSLLRQS